MKIEAVVPAVFFFILGLASSLVLAVLLAIMVFSATQPDTDDDEQACLA